MAYRGGIRQRLGLQADRNRRGLPRSLRWTKLFMSRVVGLTTFGARSRSRSPPATAGPEAPLLDRVLARTFVRNEISARTTQRLAAAAVRSGVPELTGVASAGGGNEQSANLSRDMLRRLTRQAACPPPYLVKTVCQNKRARTMEEVTISVMLPHEILQHVLQGDEHKRYIPGTGTKLAERTQRFCVNFQCPADKTVPVDMWADSTVYQKNDSLEQVIIGLSADPGGWRFPIYGLPKKFLCACGCKSRCALDPLMEALAWSLRVLALGIYPRRRHDGTAWVATDRSRAQLGGKRMVCFGYLAHWKADWDWLQGGLSLSSSLVRKRVLLALRLHLCELQRQKLLEALGHRCLVGEGHCKGPQHAANI